MHLPHFLESRGMNWNNDMAGEKKKCTVQIKTVPQEPFISLFFPSTRSDPQTPGSLGSGDALVNLR